MESGGPSSLAKSDSFLKFFRLRVLDCNNSSSNELLPATEFGSAADVAGTGGKFLLRLSNELTESFFNCIIISFGPDERVMVVFLRKRERKRQRNKTAEKSADCLWTEARMGGGRMNVLCC